MSYFSEVILCFYLFWNQIQAIWTKEMWTFFLWSSPELGIAVNPKANLENPCWELGFLFITEFFAKIWRYQRVSNVLWKNKQADEVDWRITVLGPNRENIFLDLRTPHKWFAWCLSQTSFISIRSSSLLARRENRPTENGTYRRVKLLNEAIPNIAKKNDVVFRLIIYWVYKGA